jgi:hypothetical protein
MGEIEELKKEIAGIKERNKRVEVDKSWETSWSRKLVIFTLTYVAIVVYFYAVGLPDPLVNSFVPALAFVISTLSLSFFKGFWVEHVYRK